MRVRALVTLLVFLAFAALHASAPFGFRYQYLAGGVNTGQKDGVTNPDPIGGNTRASLSADDDDGYFRAQARAYYRVGALRLP